MKFRLIEDTPHIFYEQDISLQAGGNITVTYGHTGLKAMIVWYIGWFMYEVVNQGRV